MGGLFSWRIILCAILWLVWKDGKKRSDRVFRGVPLVVEDWLLFILQSEFLVGRSLTA